MLLLSRLLLVSLIVCYAGEASAQVVRYQGPDGRHYFTNMPALSTSTPAQTKKAVPPKLYRYRTASGSLLFFEALPPSGPRKSIKRKARTAAAKKLTYLTTQEQICEAQGRLMGLVVKARDAGLPLSQVLNTLRRIPHSHVWEPEEKAWQETMMLTLYELRTITSASAQQIIETQCFKRLMRAQLD